MPLELESFHGAVGSLSQALEHSEDAVLMNSLDDVERWMDHHEALNETTHTYRKATADEVYAAIPAFLDDARLLLAALEARND